MAGADLTGKTLKVLLSEAFYGNSGKESWFMNPNDGGLLGLLEGVSAAEASTEPGPGRRTIAAHSTHILYHLELIEKVLSGNYNAFREADWKPAWKNQTVNDAQWRELVGKIRAKSDLWIGASPKVDVTDEMMLTGSMASVVHFALHYGAIKQMLLTVREKGKVKK